MNDNNIHPIHLTDSGVLLEELELPLLLQLLCPEAGALVVA